MKTQNRISLGFSVEGLVIMLAIFSLQSSCQATAPKRLVNCEIEVYQDTTAKPFALSYNLHEPDWTLELPGRLDEISGLGMNAAGTHLLAVQDEDGKIFWIDPKKEEVSQEVKFWKDGDYEGIEVVGDTIYVIKSTGTVYEVTMDGEEAITVKYNEFLNDDNDVEGLGYDPEKNHLLLACKANAGTDEELDFTKAIYAFDLEKKKLLEDPRYCIRLQQVNDYLDTDPLIRKLEKLEEFFAPGESDFGFSPSGLAVQPGTGHLYILSSVGKLLMILDPQGQILHIEKLKKSIHPQPEGICFDQKGNLYVSNEGKNGKGTIHRFNFLTQ
ncbi:MAG TPA: SdiA-regulated domain-containing protein [Saprospiraceae bacterium]|nr:SdiA-regulated domain-containing protein [Saprospiraceae bacterium]